ncbi:hypothetical protein F183_A33700 [Bryobacterales bacterium F-183]|nr:hypothetical protein F183_A33700 [Bryobacterales bacterium F-183]
MSIFRRLYASIFPDSVRTRAEEEAAFHVDMKADDYIAQGMSPREAQLRARRDFGNVAMMQEETGNRDLFLSLEGFANDARVAWRRLRRSPVFLATSVFLLAFGIGVNTAIFSVVDHLLLRPLPLPNPDRLYVVEEYVEGKIRNSNPARLADWAARVESFERTASTYGETIGLDDNGSRRGVQVMRMVGDWPAVLGLSPVEGRSISPTEDNVALLTRSGAARFGKIGSKLRLGEEIFEVVGILPDEVALGEEVGILTPAPRSVMNASRRAGFLTVAARLRPNATLAAATAQAEAAAQSMGKDHPETDRGMTVKLVDAQAAWTSDIRKSAWMLQGASMLLLIITIANLAALLAARTKDRERETRIRSFLGATKWSIVRLHMVEAGLVSLLGCFAAAGVAVLGLKYLQNAFANQFAAISIVTIDARVFTFVLALGLVATLLCTAIMASRRSLGMRASALVVIEASLGLLLVAAAFGIAKEFADRQSRPLGFAPQNLLVARVDMPWSVDNSDIEQVIDRGLEQFGALPGVMSVAVVDRLPLGGGTQSAKPVIRGRQEPVTEEVGFRMATPTYFATMTIPILAGNGLGEKDTVVVNDVLSRRYFDGNPIGRYISNDGKKFFRIAGVVGGVRTESKNKEAMPEVWLSYRDWAWPKLEFILSTSQPASALAPSLRRLVTQLHASALLDDVTPLQQRLDKVDLEPRRGRDMLALFGFVALCLVIAGVYGVMAGESLRRTREMGIRLAIGATPTNIFGLILKQALKLAAISLVIAIPLGLYSGQLEPRMLIYAGLAIATAIAFAALWPAWRAARIAPATALRTE